MAQADAVIKKTRPAVLHPVTALRIAIIVVAVVIWEVVSASGLLFRDVVPSLLTIGRAIVNCCAVRISIGTWALPAARFLARL